MTKRNLPIGGGNRKRWIDRLSDEHFNSLNEKDKNRKKIKRQNKL